MTNDCVKSFNYLKGGWHFDSRFIVAYENKDLEIYILIYFCHDGKDWAKQPWNVSIRIWRFVFIFVFNERYFQYCLSNFIFKFYDFCLTLPFTAKKFWDVAFPHPLRWLANNLARAPRLAVCWKEEKKKKKGEKFDYFHLSMTSDEHFKCILWIFCFYIEINCICTNYKNVWHYKVPIFNISNWNDSIL